MLLEFKVKNYKSFADEMCFSMIAAPKQNDLKYSLFKCKTGGQDYKIQCSSVIYGANASGKSNIISAMDTFKSIILKGNIKNSKKAARFNIASSALEYIPNVNRTDLSPVEFTIEFIDGSLLFKYTLSLDLGRFFELGYNRKVVAEEFYLNNKLVFRRSDNSLEFGEYKHLQKYLSLKQTDIDKTKVIYASKSLNDEDLFLTNGFKNLFSVNLVKAFTDWIEKNFIIITSTDSIELTEFDSSKEEIDIEPVLNEAINAFGAKFNTLGYKQDEEKLLSIIETAGNEYQRKIVLPAVLFESSGTVKFIKLFSKIRATFETGATLVVDELDTSIHPSAIMNIINMFHNDSVNKNHAQLIFITHNPVYLNSNLFRRDEIKFVQRNKDTGNSEIYALSDFGTSGKTGVRCSTAYMKNYLDYNYGAIEDVDFTSVFEKIIIG